MAAAGLWGLVSCSGPTEPVEPALATEDAGSAVVRLGSGPGGAGALVVRIEGGHLEEVTPATDDLVLHLAALDEGVHRVLVKGTIREGPLLRARVPEGAAPSEYIVVVEQVADAATYRQRDPADYAVEIQMK